MKLALLSLLLLSSFLFTSCGDSSKSQEPSDAAQPQVHNSPISQATRHTQDVPNNINLDESGDEYSNPPTTYFSGTITNNGRTVSFTNRDDYLEYDNWAVYWRKCKFLQLKFESLKYDFNALYTGIRTMYSDYEDGKLHISTLSLMQDIERIRDDIRDIQHIPEISSYLDDAESYADYADTKAFGIQNNGFLDDLNECSSYMQKCASSCEDAANALNETIQQLEIQMYQIESRQ